MKKIKITNELCAEFNKFRAEHNRIPFSSIQMKNIFRGFGFKDSNYLTVAKQLGIIIPIERGTYRFSPTPVHIKKLENLVDSSRALARKYMRKSRDKKISQNDSTEDTAINLLKELGYKVSKPQIDIEAALKNPDSAVKNFIKWVAL